MGRMDRPQHSHVPLKPTTDDVGEWNPRPGWVNECKLHESAVAFDFAQKG